MYKVYIVDDESWVVESLKASVNWEEYGFKVIGQSYNGFDALDRISVAKPDLVFTDVRMPGLNGLEVIKKINGLLPNTLFIVISGYAEFAYAQKAMQYGAIGYCLKPFDEEEIIRLLQKAKILVEKAHNSIENELLALLESRNRKSIDAMHKILEAGGLLLDEGKKIIPVVAIGSERLMFPKSAGSMAIKLGLNKYGYLLQYNDEIDLVEQFEQNINENTRGVGVGYAIESMEKIWEHMELASIAAYQFFITGKPGVYKLDQLQNEDISRLIVMFEDKIIKKNMRDVDKLISETSVGFENGIYNIKQAFVFYNTLMSILYKGTSEKYEDFIFSYEQLIEQFGNSFKMLMSLKKSILGDMNSLRNYTSADIKNNNFREIVKYIDKNFYKEISIQTISQEFCINPSYICHLFKREMQSTFTDYLSKLRVSYACKLLKETDLSINEISERAGFNDYFYFSRVFKKYAQTTPSQYRNEP